MKVFFLLIVLVLFSACEEFRYERDKDDGSISGSVTFLINQLSISSAMAQTPQEYQDELSDSLLAGDFFTLYSSAVYADLVAAAVDDGQFYVSNAGGLISSNASLYGYGDFPDGILVAYGFDQNKKIVSLNFSAVDQAGKYSLKDPAYQSVSYYKLSFVLNSAGSPQYRLSYIFRDGYKIVNDVTYTSSMASVKLSEEIGKNPATPLSTLKTMSSTFVKEVASEIPSDDERGLANYYVAYHYSSYPSLDPVQKFILESSIVHAMRTDARLRSIMSAFQPAFYEMLMLGRPADPYVLLDQFCGARGEDGAYLLSKIDEAVEQLKALGLIPTPRAVILL